MCPAIAAMCNGRKPRLSTSCATWGFFFKMARSALDRPPSAAKCPRSSGKFRSIISRTTRALSACTAKWIGSSPRESLPTSSEPRFIKCCTSSVCPCEAAKWRGERPSGSDFSSKFARLWSKKSTAPTWPPFAAKCIAFASLLRRNFELFSIDFITSTWPCMAARWIKSDLLPWKKGEKNSTKETWPWRAAKWIGSRPSPSARIWAPAFNNNCAAFWCPQTAAACNALRPTEASASFRWIASSKRASCPLCDARSNGAADLGMWPWAPMPSTKFSKLQVACAWSPKKTTSPGCCTQKRSFGFLGCADNKAHGSNFLKLEMCFASLIHQALIPFANHSQVSSWLWKSSPELFTPIERMGRAVKPSISWGSCKPCQSLRCTPVSKSERKIVGKEIRSSSSRRILSTIFK